MLNVLNSYLLTYLQMKTRHSNERRKVKQRYKWLENMLLRLHSAEIKHFHVLGIMSHGLIERRTLKIKDRLNKQVNKFVTKQIK